MSIFAKGSPEDYLQHIIAVLYLIDQKGLHVQCKKHVKEMKNAASALRAIQRKFVGPEESGAQNQDQEDLKTEEKLTQELLSTANKQYNEAVGATYELLHRPSGIASSERCTSMTHGLVQMARSTMGSTLRVLRPFWTA
jgi:hypothetical protein